MNRAIFWRLVWKEYRLQRALWLAIVVLIVLLELLILALSDRLAQPPIDALFTLAMVLAACYGLGVGATLFAAERENGTYEFQRAVPVTSLRLFAVKVTFAMASTAALFAAVWVLSYAVTGWKMPAPREHLELWGLWGFAALEVLVWGILFSLLTSRPLLAAILAVSAASFSVHETAWLAVRLGMVEGLRMVAEPATYLAAVPLRLVVIVAVALVDLRIGTRWLGEIGGTRRQLLPSLRRFSLAAVRPRAARDSMLPSRSSMLGRLVWQQWRQSARMFAALVVLALVLALAWIWVHGYTSLLSDNTRVDLTVGMVALIAVLVGATAFLGDHQQESSRFLAERGVRPTSVWLSRQAVGIAVVLALLAVVLPIFLLAYSWRPDPAYYWRGYWYDLPWILRRLEGLNWSLVSLRDVNVLLTGAALAYAAGQLASMLFRSGILAGLFGVVLAAAACGWARAMEYLGVDWSWSVWPIPLVLLLTTWLRTPDWLRGRNAFWPWLRVGLATAVPLGLILAAIPIVRVHQVPLVDPGFSVEEYLASTTPEGLATAEMYRRAIDAYVRFQPAPEPPRQEPPKGPEIMPPEGPPVALRPEVAAWVNENRDAIEITLQASKRRDCDFYDPARLSTYAERRADLSDLANVLVYSGRLLQTEGKLDEAGERYLAALRVSRHMRFHAIMPFDSDRIEAFVYEYLPSWTAHAGQTSQRIAGMLRQIDRVLAELPPQCDQIKTQYVRWQRAITGDRDAMALVMTPREITWQALFAHWIPGEQARALRVLNRVTAREMAECRNLEEQDANNKGLPASAKYYWDGLRQRQWPLRRWKTPLLPDTLSWLAVDGRGLARIESQRRVVRLMLALQAWRLEHGTLPESLDVLVGPYLDRLPMDPVTGKPFHYLPGGLPFPVLALTYLYHHDWQEVVAGTPILASSDVDLALGKGELNDEFGYHGQSLDDATPAISQWRATRLLSLPQPGK